jgi:hypothetical protein
MTGDWWLYFPSEGSALRIFITHKNPLPLARPEPAAASSTGSVASTLTTRASNIHPVSRYTHLYVAEPVISGKKKIKLVAGQCLQFNHFPDYL